MAHRTFGAGGDAAGIVEAWTYLASVSPLDDNYVYRQVGNCTVNNNWPNQALAVNRVDLNGHSVKFYCPYANSHKGDPTKGYKIFVNGVEGIIDLRTSNSDNSESVIVDGLYIEKTDNADVIILLIGPFASANANNIYVRNLLIKGDDPDNSTGIKFPMYGSNIYVSNLKIWDVNIGFGGNFTSGNPIGLHVVENTTVYNYGDFGYIFNATASVVQGWILRNSDSVEGAAPGPTAGFSQNIGANVILMNCADTDGSIITGNYTKSNCISNIVAANEFASLLDTDPDFLDFLKGTADLNAAGSPIIGKAPLDVKFNADILFTPGSESLGVAGTAPQISGHDTDIAGNPIPGVDDLYSIGAHEQQYSNFEGM